MAIKQLLGAVMGGGYCGGVGWDGDSVGPVLSLGIINIQINI